MLKGADPINQCLDNGIALNAWTVDSKLHAKRLIDKGVEYITTNTLQPAIYGDANDDVAVTAADVLLIRRKIAGQDITLGRRIL